MPIRSAGPGKYTFGGGVFNDLATAKRSYRAYLAKKHDKPKLKSALARKYKKR